MKTIFSVLTIAPLMLSLASCMTFDKDFDDSFMLVRRARYACNASTDNAPLAQKECFPLLTDKKILVSVREISNSDGRSTYVWGHAGAKEFNIFCYPDDKRVAEIMKDPNLIQIGGKYWVEGKFYRYSRFTYELKDCKITPFSSRSKH